MHSLQNLKFLKRCEFAIGKTNLLSMIALQKCAKRSGEKPPLTFSQIKRMFSTENREESKDNAKGGSVKLFKEWKAEDSLAYFRNSRKWFPSADIRPRDAQSFRVMTYNSLADCYVKEKEYKGATDEDLAWENRYKLIIKEIDQENFMEDSKEESTTKPDIICFQEFLDTKLTEYLTTQSKIKYEFEIKRKVRGRQDHIAIFWNSELFQKLNSWSVSMDSKKNCEIYSKPQNTQESSIELIDEKKNKEDVIVLVCSTHLIFSNTRGEIKLAQVDLITKSIQYLKEQLKSQYPDSKVNVILTGDFNCVPNSGVYNFMADGEYDCLTMKRNEISGQKFAFAKPDYVHNYIDLDIEVLETIELNNIFT